MNQSHSTIELPCSSQPEIRQGRIALYMKSGKWEMYSIYLLHFVWKTLDLAKQKF